MSQSAPPNGFASWAPHGAVNDQLAFGTPPPATSHQPYAVTSTIVVSPMLAATDWGAVALPPALANFSLSDSSVGSMLMPSGSVSHYAVLDHVLDFATYKETWGPLMHTIALDLWKLKEPKVLISVTGGAQDFSMSRVDNDKVMQGLMQVAIETSVWFVTGGTKAGIMSLVGKARTQYAADAPLIGVAAWHASKGHDAIEAHCADVDKPPGDTLLSYQEKVLSVEDGVELDHNHSHFFLIKGQKRGFGEEIVSRSEFEQSVCKGMHGRKTPLLDAIRNCTQWRADHTEPEPKEPAFCIQYPARPEHEPKKQDASVKAAVETRETQTQTATAKGNHHVPVVSVCVQGGPGTVETVLSAAQNQTPCLIVNGSGKAADLISDMIMLRELKDGDKAKLAQLSLRQKTLHSFLVAASNGDPDEAAVRQRAEKIVSDSWNTGPGQTLKEDADKESRELSDILAAYWDSGAAKNGNTAKAFVDASKLVYSPLVKLCKVFDLSGEESLSDSMLACIFGGLEQDPRLHGPERAKELLAKKLTLAVEFNNLSVMRTLVQASKGGTDAGVLQKAMQSALHTAMLKTNRPEIVDYLVNHGAQVSGYDMKLRPSKKPQPVDDDVAGQAARARGWKELVMTTVPKYILKTSDYPNKLGTNDELFPGEFAVLVKKVMGSGFEYQMSQISPEFDLMILSVLRNDRDLAFVWWKEYCFPVRSALSIAMLYRELAKKPNIIPHHRSRMKESGQFFEELAMQVQHFCLEEDYFLGISNLETGMKIWNGNTLVDVAIRCGAEDFLATCCREAIDRRFAGDLQAYSQSLLLFKGLKVNVFINLCFLGFLAPFLMTFENFPLAQKLRFPTQRMAVPDNFRRRASRRYLFDSDKSGESGELVEKMEEDMAREVSNWHKFKLFWQAPITLFIAGAMQKGFLVVAFTWWLFSTPDFFRSEPFFNSKATSPELDTGLGLDWAVWPFEAGACLLFLSSVIAEAVQCYILGAEYWHDFWNWLDASAIAFFFAGFAMRNVCTASSDRSWCLRGREESVSEERMWVYMYSICVFLLWVRMLRLLSVSKRLGPLVILVVNMGQDISLFALVYAIFLMAFSVLIRGSMPNHFEHCTGAEDDPESIKCWSAWWIIRTFIQSSGGEIFVDDMKTDSALVGLVLLWVVMNLLLLNLVIAIMSSTYDTVREKAGKVFLVDLYDITNEYARRSAAAPWPLNVLFILFDVVRYNFERHKVQEIWPGSGSSNTRRQFDLFVRRNMPINALYKQHKYNKALRPAADGAKTDKVETREQVIKTLDLDSGRNEQRLIERDIEVEHFWECKMNAFTERARNTFLQNDAWRELKSKWSLRMEEDTPGTKAVPVADIAPPTPLASLPDNPTSSIRIATATQSQSASASQSQDLYLRNMARRQYGSA